MSEFSEMYDECPKCDNELSVERCHAIDCDDGYYEDEDGVNGTEQVRCDECCGTGFSRWCRECGWDAVHKQFLSPKYEQEYLANHPAEKGTSREHAEVFLAKQSSVKNNVESELLPCPFCGEKAVLTNVRQSNQNFRVSCVNELCFRPSTDYGDREEVIRLWDLRNGQTRED